jgi:hypothetical protein
VAAPADVAGIAIREELSGIHVNLQIPPAQAEKLSPNRRTLAELTWPRMPR